MKLIFFGTGKFGLPVIKRLMASDHDVLAVVTQPDRKKGRGYNVQPMPVKALVEQISPSTEILQPFEASNEEFVDMLKEMDADLFVVVDYGQLLRREVLEVPGKYCINLHPSLLPKYRGASPVNRVVLNGDAETGTTVFRMNERMDAGSIILQARMDIGVNEDAESLFERLSDQGADLIMKALDEIGIGQEHFTEQDEKKATYAPKLKKEDGHIDWSRSAVDVIRKIRGLKPWPGAFTSLDGKQLKLIEAEVVDSPDQKAPPGTVFDKNRMVVNAAQGAVKVEVLQLEGKKAMTTEEFLRGHSLEEGTVLGK